MSELIQVTDELYKLLLSQPERKAELLPVVDELFPQEDVFAAQVRRFFNDEAFGSTYGELHLDLFTKYLQLATTKRQYPYLGGT